jgi:UDP-N-acetylmuramyl pentapeptide phosphotransferase/UDP-N-acetylglucosamine-1-phosphate transferase|tara:strand:+ start:2884 stop:3876 length:993 start_codon:yes stop_codon:yes gene_type:complete
MWPALVLIVIAAIFTALATRAVLPWLRRMAIMDVPNARSSHHMPTPRGGGLAVVPVLLLLMIVGWMAYSDVTLGHLALLAGAVGLAIIGFMDDRSEQSPLLRFFVQTVAVLVALSFLDGPVFQGVMPFWLDRILTIVAWLWMVNAVNFMDGIDGITVSELGMVGAGIFLLGIIVPAIGGDLLVAGAVTVGAMVGFGIWNWHPARLFMGDVGSLPLGFLAGGLLLALASRGFWLPAIILPLYYAADATITLVTRLLRGERIFDAHRSHFYQRAVQGKWSHAHTSSAVLALNAVLVLLALPLLHLGEYVRLLMAALATALLLLAMTRAAKRA